MAIETELKFRVRDFKTIRTRLRKLGAKRVGRHKEENTLFHARPGFTLRMRKINVRGILTTKGRKLPGRAKRRPELETEVPYAPVFRVLSLLGIRIVYQKKREDWTYRNCLISLDELPVIGKFVEIEARNESRIKAVAQALKLGRGTKISYPQLFNRAAPKRKSFRF